MDCKAYRSYMWPYLKEQLDDGKIYTLLSHVVTCPECKNELKTQFLVSEGIKRLEAGNYGFNLLNEYESKIQTSMKRCKDIRRTNMLIMSASSILLTFSVLIIFLSILF